MSFKDSTKICTDWLCPYLLGRMIGSGAPSEGDAPESPREFLKTWIAVFCPQSF